MEFLREFKLIFSTILTIFGIIILIIGIFGMWLPDILKSSLNFNEDILKWSIYFLILGFIVFAFGIYYLYTYLKNKKFLDEVFNISKRSEFQKKHLKIKKTVKYMPKKYKDMFKKREEEFHLK